METSTVHVHVLYMDHHDHDHDVRGWVWAMGMCLWGRGNEVFLLYGTVQYSTDRAGRVILHWILRRQQYAYEELTDITRRRTRAPARARKTFLSSEAKV